MNASSTLLFDSLPSLGLLPPPEEPIPILQGYPAVNNVTL
jgi:hypothetical protein